MKNFLQRTSTYFNVLQRTSTYFNVLIASFLTFACLSYTSCRKSDSVTASLYLSEKLASDPDFKQLLILQNESKAGFTFLDINNTKEKKAQILSDLKSFSSKTDEYSQLQVLKILGYKNLEEYLIAVKKMTDLVNLINEKYPTFKDLPKDSMQSIFIKTTQSLQSELPFIIYPNKNGVAAIYRNDNLNLKAPTLRIRDCCHDVWSNMQHCYLVYDYAYFISITFGCPAACSGFFEAPPLAYGCLIGCIGLSGFAYGAGLDYCTSTAYVDSYSCPESCF